MGDALRQLYALGAIDEDGAVTDLGREMSPLPVEPQLARAMLAARRFGCVDEMATVAAMLSVERGVHRERAAAGGGGDGDGDRRGAPPESLCSEHERRMGDHVVLMRTYQAWARGGHRRDFCERHGLSDRGMEFARDVRKQLLGVFREMEGGRRRRATEGLNTGERRGGRAQRGQTETRQESQPRPGQGQESQPTSRVRERGRDRRQQPRQESAETGAGTGAWTGEGTGAGRQGQGQGQGAATGAGTGTGAGMTKPSAGTSPPFVRPSASASATASLNASPSTTASAPSTTTRCSPRYTRRPLVRSRTKSPACCPSGSCTMSWWRRRACFCATSARSRPRGWPR